MKTRTLLNLGKPENINIKSVLVAKLDGIYAFLVSVVVFVVVVVVVVIVENET